MSMNRGRLIDGWQIGRRDTQSPNPRRLSFPFSNTLLQSADPFFQFSRSTDVRKVVGGQDR